MAELNKVVDDMRSFFKKQKGNLYAIEGHPLEKEDDYVKEIYLTMLSTIAQYGGAIGDNEKLFLERILSGVGVKESSVKYIRKALEINDKFTEDFIKLLSDKDIKYNFVVDALIMAVAKANMDSKRVELIAEMCEALKISNKQMEFLSKAGLSIIGQDGSAYQNLVNVESEIDLRGFYCYTKDFFEGIFINTVNLSYVSFDEKTRGNLQQSILKTLKGNNVVIENAVVDLSVVKKVKFGMMNSVQLRNCLFRDGEEEIYFDDVDNIIIDKCRFENFRSEVLKINKCGELAVTNSEFIDCRYSEKETVIRNINPKMVHIKNCKFYRCFGYNGYDSNGIILYFGLGYMDIYANVFVENCTFKDCQYEHFNRDLFEGVIEKNIKGCKFIGNNGNTRNLIGKNGNEGVF